MLSLAHMTPLLIPTYWAVFAAGVAAGTLLGYRLGLLRLGLRKTKPNHKDS